MFALTIYIRYVKFSKVTREGDINIFVCNK